MRRVIVAKNLHRTQYFDTRCFGIQNEHSMARMFFGLRVRAGHQDINSTTRVPRPRDPPFFTIQNPVIAIFAGGKSQLRCIRRCYVRFGHHIGGPDFAIKQIPEPAIFMGLGPVSFKHFHVTCVRRVTIEHLGRNADFAHFFGQICIFYCGQAISTITVGQPKIPQPTFTRERFETIQNF